MTRTRVDKNKSQIFFNSTDGTTDYTTMNLSTIPNRKVVDRKSTENYSLRVDDINSQKATRKLNLPDYTLKVDDIEGSRSKPMVDLSVKPKNLLNIDDIDGAKPKIIRQLPHSKRMINPGDPVYNLPSYEEEPPVYPKFIRDPLNNDVDGAHPMPLYSNKPPRDIMKVDDIVGQHKDLIKTAKTRTTNLDVSDINNDGLFVSKRHTNPLTPEYTIMGQKLENDFGIQEPKKAAHKGPFYSLSTSDIPGATADSLSAKYRSFRPPPPPSEEDELKPAPILMLSGMEKQTAELNRIKESQKLRAEKIQYYENRNLHTDNHSNDVAQTILRQQRNERMKKHSGQISNLTFS